MNIRYATYVDHQPEVQYPIEFQVRENPDLIVYCSDAENAAYLAKSGIQSEIIDFKISAPGDIATAQNICLKRTFDRYSPDFVVWVQADIYITDLGYALIRAFCNDDSNFVHAATLTIQHLRLFIIACQSQFGITIIGKDSNQTFKYDGAYVSSYQELGKFDLKDRVNIPAVDIGYLTIDQYKRHRSRNAKTWRDNENTVDFTDMQYLDFVLARDRGLINDNTMLEKDTYLYSVIQKMGLEYEYDKVKKLLIKRNGSNL